jgi:DNA-binding transcriptional regulator GbsR (MarR family)
MDRVTAIFVDGIGAAAATSGILNQLQGRIFALLYVQPRPMSLDDIAAELELSKSNVSVSIRGLVEWHLIRRVPIAGSRKDHYEAATDFWQLLREVIERRHRFSVRQVLVAVEESERVAGGVAPSAAAERERAAFVRARLESLRAFFSVLDMSIAAFGQGKPLSPDELKKVSPIHTARYKRMR